MDTILVTGGGGAVLGKYLQPLVNGQLVLPEADDARLLNVLGYWKFGKHIWAKGVIPSPPRPSA